MKNDIQNFKAKSFAKYTSYICIFFWSGDKALHLRPSHLVEDCLVIISDVISEESFVLHEGLAAHAMINCESHVTSTECN